MSEFKNSFISFRLHVKCTASLEFCDPKTGQPKLFVDIKAKNTSASIAAWSLQECGNFALIESYRNLIGDPPRVGKSPDPKIVISGPFRHNIQSTMFNSFFHGLYVVQLGRKNAVDFECNLETKTIFLHIRFLLLDQNEMSIERYEQFLRSIFLAEPLKWNNLEKLTRSEI